MVISLDRKFIDVQPGEKLDFSLHDVFYARHGSDGWDSLLQHRRIVILAEAGSGKTTELRLQAETLTQKGEITFYVPLHRVAKEGLPKALSSKDRATFSAWLHSDGMATFFIDSVDETKDANIRFEDALAQIADGIAGGEGRCKIILTGRYTDWDFKTDLNAVEEYLPVPNIGPDPASLSADEALRRVLYREDAEEKPMKETPRLVVMAGLDQGQIEQYFRAKDLRDTDKILHSIDEYNLWDLARRPLDLDWLAKYWKAKGCLGKLDDMIELSLMERISEADPYRSRSDDLNKEKSISAIERVGAGLVLGKTRDISLTGEDPGLDLPALLPDWSPKERQKLLSRAVFDPATFGRTRLTNDNNGVVRSFLAAKWFMKRLKQGWPSQSLRNLLFGHVYDKTVVRPSLAEVAAWLSLWDADVAADVVRIDPGLLLASGDPASLPLSLKEAALQGIIKSLELDAEIHGPGQDSLQRFSTPDLAPCVRMLWQNYQHIRAARELLLRIIWLGRFTDCIDLAEQALNDFNDRYTRMFAGRALMNIGSEAHKKNFAEDVTKNCVKISNSLVWETVEFLFPKFLSVEQLLHIIQSIELADQDGGWGLDWHGENLSKKIQSIDVCRQLLSGLIKLYRREEPTGSAESDFIPFLIACTHRLMELAPDNSLPNEAIEAAILLRHEKNAGRRYSRTTYRELFYKTPERRRALLWGSVQQLRQDKQFGDIAFDDPWSFDIYGLSLGLGSGDIEWLLEDLSTTKEEIDRKLISNCLLTIWRNAGGDENLLNRLRDAAKTDAILADAIEHWTKPRQPSPSELRHKSEMEKFDRRQKRQEAKRDASWKEFIQEIRQKPSELQTLVPPDKEKGIDRRLYYLWTLITNSNQSRWAVKDVSILEDILGKEAALAVQNAFIIYWKSCDATAHCDRPADERNSVYATDYVGILGITLQSQTEQSWAEKLNDAEASKATTFATLELNGFPDWLSDVADAHPQIVENTLLRIIEIELQQDEAGASGILADVARAHTAIQDLLSPRLNAIFKSGRLLSSNALRDILTILRRYTIGQGDLLNTCLDRFKTVSDTNAKALYLGAAFAIDPAQAAAVLSDILQPMDFAEQRALCTYILPIISGDRFREEAIDLRMVPASVLERLVRIAFQTIRVQDDHNRPSGKAYSPDERDNAEGARGILLKALIDKPGEYTYRTLLGLAETPDFGVSSQRLRELANERAHKDAEIEDWAADSVARFEDDLIYAAHTAKDMCDLCLGHIESMEHNLLHSDFAQGSTLAMQPDEAASQNWFGDRLSRSQFSYTVERESHVVEEKEPDIRIRSRSSNAAVPIEIKVAESWTITQLEDALRSQLCGQYLRDQDNRYGILLLIHGEPRPVGWIMPDGKKISFPDVVSHLRLIAENICASDENAPQPRIAVLDVSSCYREDTSSQTVKAGKKPKKLPARKQPASSSQTKADQR